MQVLFISWWWPYPASNGAKIRVYNLLRQLGTAHDLTLLSFAEPDEATPEQVAHMQTFCQRVEVIAKPQYQPNSWDALAGYLSRWPRSLIDVYSPPMAERVQALCADNAMQVVIASELQTLRYLELVPHTRTVMEEMEVTIFYNQTQEATSRLKRLRAELTLSKVKNAVRRLSQRGTLITVVSENEQRFIREMTGCETYVIPNGVDTQMLTPGPESPQPFTLIYPGAVTYNANYDAVAYFIREVLPIIRAQAPETRFTVTGGTGSVDVRDLAAQPGVQFSGFVADLAPLIRQQWATVVPLRIGGGTRLKILESMALGTPVIATAKGAEGLAVTADENILIADTPQAIADAVLALFHDTPRRQRLAASGRQLVESRYDWAGIGQRFVQLIEQ